MEPGTSTSPSYGQRRSTNTSAGTGTGIIARSFSDVNSSSPMAPDLRAQIQRLRGQVKEIQTVVKTHASEVRSRSKRSRVDFLSADVNTNNPYSRVMALKRMGAVLNYERIRNYAVAILGVGALGGAVAEMLVRAGIGKLCLVDSDHVEMANLSRLFYKAEQGGMTKVQAAKLTLAGLNPDVVLDSLTGDFTNPDTLQRLREKVMHDGIDGRRPYDLLVVCVDNHPARLVANSLSLELNVPCITSKLLPDGSGGHVVFTDPGRSACIECDSPFMAVMEDDEGRYKSEGSCTASLPSTEMVMAGIAGHTALKYLLEFGEVVHYQVYDAVANEFPSQNVKPSMYCRHESCLKRQEQLRQGDLTSYAQPIGAAAVPVNGSPSRGSTAGDYNMSPDRRSVGSVHDNPDAPLSMSALQPSPERKDAHLDLEQKVKLLEAQLARERAERARMETSLKGPPRSVSPARSPSPLRSASPTHPR
eukprot:GILJ01003003.1.p1 GENE.GILJ01003003.1~~GILJ01003003.1.p1  ORF type:complete len:475 (-),score=45.19 GILJ01003003.1:171-1595(-)